MSEPRLTENETRVLDRAPSRTHDTERTYYFTSATIDRLAEQILTAARLAFDDQGLRVGTHGDMEGARALALDTISKSIGAQAGEMERGARIGPRGQSPWGKPLIGR